MYKMCVITVQYYVNASVITAPHECDKYFGVNMKPVEQKYYLSNMSDLGRKKNTWQKWNYWHYKRPKDGV